MNINDICSFSRGKIGNRRSVVDELPWLMVSFGMPSLEETFGSDHLDYWLKHAIKYIAFRPFENLDMDRAMYYLKKVKRNSYTRIDYQIIYRLEGDDESKSRIGHVRNHSDDFLTGRGNSSVDVNDPRLNNVRKKIEELRAFFMKHGRSIVISHIVKVTSWHREEGDFTPQKMAADIYALQTIDWTAHVDRLEKKYGHNSIGLINYLRQVTRPNNIGTGYGQVAEGKRGQFEIYYRLFKEWGRPQEEALEYSGLTLAEVKAKEKAHK